MKKFITEPFLTTQVHLTTDPLSNYHHYPHLFSHFPSYLIFYLPSTSISSIFVFRVPLFLNN